MKKLIAIFVMFLLTLFASSCKNQLNLEMYLSQNRSVAYVNQSSDYLLTVYGEEREDSFLSDGFVGSQKKFITVRLEDYKKSLDEASVTLSFGGTTVEGKFEYSPLNGKFVTEIETDKLPTDKEITAVIKNAGEETTLTLSGFTLDGAIDYKEALSSVSKTAVKEINKMLEGGGSIEVRLRKIVQSNRLYYYVSIIDKAGKTLAYLVDGENGKVIASKTF